MKPAQNIQYYLPGGESDVRCEKWVERIIEAK